MRLFPQVKACKKLNEIQQSIQGMERESQNVFIYETE